MAEAKGDSELMEKIGELRAKLKESIEKELAEYKEKAQEATEKGSDLPPLPKYDTEFLNDDYTVERFIKARKWDITGAHNQLLKCIKWRAEFNGGRGVKSVTMADCIGEVRCGKTRLYGVDKKGRPVAWVKSKLHIHNSKDPDEFNRFLVWTMEAGFPLQNRRGLQGFCVLDLEGVGWANMDLSHLPFIFSTLQDFYPELLGGALVINAPWIFSASWSLIKTFLDPVVVSKIEFVTKQDLPKYIDESQLLPDDLWGAPINVEAGETLFSSPPVATTVSPSTVNASPALAPLESK